jgi:hypothetical protein
MKKYILLLFSIVFLSGNSITDAGSKKLMNFDKFPLPVPGKNLLLAQWGKKPVLETKINRKR